MEDFRLLRFIYFLLAGVTFVQAFRLYERNRRGNYERFDGVVVMCMIALVFAFLATFC